MNTNLQLQTDRIARLCIGVRKPHFILLRCILFPCIKYMKLWYGKMDAAVPIDLLWRNAFAELLADIVQTPQRHIFIRRTLMLNKYKIVPRQQKRNIILKLGEERPCKCHNLYTFPRRIYFPMQCARKLPQPRRMVKVHTEYRVLIPPPALFTHMYSHLHL